MSGNTGDGSSEQDGVRQHYQQEHAPPYQQQQEQIGANQQQHREDVPPTQFVSVEEHDELPESSNATATSASTANASLATAAAAAAASAAVPTGNTAPAVSHSVVPDLMRVYESMIQSKTPQDYGSGPPPPQQQQAPQPQQQQNEGYYQNDHQQHQQEKHPPPQDLAPGFYHYNQVQQPLPAGSQQQQPPQQQQQQQWTYDATSIPIPAPYPLPLSSEQQSQQNPPPQPPNQPQRSSSVTSTSSGRSLRKRSAPKPPSPQQEQHPSEEDYVSSASSGGGGKSRRTSKKGGKSKQNEEDKTKKNDSRWSKRFTWPEDLHRDFVSAIFDVGLKQSSPATVLEQMPAHEQITTERIKSHLQKYRLHRQKSKKEFMSSYTATVQKLNTEGLKDVTSLAGGQVAGHLTYAALTQPDPIIDEDRPPLAGQRSLATSPGQPVQQDMIVLPRLTESEKQSPMGSSLGYLLGLFFSLKEQLDRQRQQKEVAAAEAEKRFVEEQQSRQQHVDMYDSFVSDDHPPAALPQYTAAVASAPNNMGPPTVQSSTRSNLEQSSMMKREMQSQMSFQNKLRALKQQELDKYNKLAHAMAQQQQHAPAASHMQQQQQQQHPVSGGGGGESKQGGDPDMVLAAEMQQQEFQGTGEAGGRTRGMSIAEDDDFWNTAVVDDELFDFLMND